MKTNSNWNPGKGDYRRNTGHSNRSIQEKEKKAFRRKITYFFLYFTLLLGATVLGNYLFCNTHKIIE